MPVDRSSQGLAQVMSEKNAKVSPVKSAKARQTSEPAGIPISPTLIVKGVRNDLSNLGGALIGGFSEVTGLKLKEKPGFDLPILASLNLGMCHIRKTYDLHNSINIIHLSIFIYDYKYFSGPKSIKKAGNDKTKLVASVQNEKQFKRQTTQPDFNAPPYAPAPAQKENPTIWYSSEQKEPVR